MSTTLPYKDAAIRGATYQGLVRLTDDGKPRGGETEYRIEGHPGLALFVQALNRKGASSKTWKFLYSFMADGRQQKRKMPLGRYPAVTLAQAAKMAAELREEIERGRDPVGEQHAQRRREEQDGLTFTDLIMDYIADRRAAGACTMDEFERAMRYDITNSPLGSMRPKDISSVDVQNTLDGVAQRLAAQHVASLERRKLPVTDHDRTRRDFDLVRHLRRYITQVFNFALLDDLAVRQSYGITTNPAAAVGRNRRGKSGGRYGKPKTRDRHLDDDGIKQLCTALADSSVAPQIQRMIKVALLTCTRSNEVRRATIEELKLDNEKPVWTLPGDRTKSKKTREMPLVPQVVAILREAVGNRKSGPVFASDETEDGFVADKVMSRAIARLISSGRMKTKHISTHDLRRTVETGLTRLGVAKEVREQVLGHTPQDVGSKHYNVHDFADEKRKALKLWADHVQAIGERD